MAKKNMRMVSCEAARCNSVSVRLAMSAMTQAGMAFCCFSLESAFLNAQNYHCRMKLSCRSSSLVGLGRPFSRKVEDISEMVFRIESKSKGVMSLSRVSSLPESHGKGSNDFVPLGSGEGLEVHVVAESNGGEVHGESLPRPSLVLVCASRNCSFTGSFCSNEVSHKLISLGSCTI